MNGTAVEEPYAFGSLPLEAVSPGTNLLVTGGTFAGASELALGLLRGGDGDGVILVSADTAGDRAIEKYEAGEAEVDRSRLCVVDCVGRETDLSPARVLPVSSPGDLTGIGMRFSKLYQELVRDGAGRVRTGIHSVSTLFAYADQRRVSRFIHTIAGRVRTVDGLGVFLADPGMVDARLLSTVGNFCNGRIDVRDEGDGPEARVRGLPGQPDGWKSL